MKRGKIVIYRGKAGAGKGCFRIKIVGKNNRILMEAEGFVNIEGAFNNLRAVHEVFRQSGGWTKVSGKLGIEEERPFLD